jgi:hypothetical protein
MQELQKKKYKRAIAEKTVNAIAVILPSISLNGVTIFSVNGILAIVENVDLITFYVLVNCCFSLLFFVG